MARAVITLCGRKGALYVGIRSTFYIMTLAKGMRYSKIHLYRVKPSLMQPLEGAGELNL